MTFLVTTIRSRQWQAAVATHCDPAGFARLAEPVDPGLLSSQAGHTALNQIATIITAKGGGIADITSGDCLELRQTEIDVARGGHGR